MGKGDDFPGLVEESVLGVTAVIDDVVVGHHERAAYKRVFCAKPPLQRKCNAWKSWQLEGKLLAATFRSRDVTCLAEPGEEISRSVERSIKSTVCPHPGIPEFDFF